MQPSLTQNADHAVRFVPPARPVNDLAADARAGLLQPPRSLPPKYFYDASGSGLFDAICDTPEYYPTRTELALLADRGASLMARAAPRAIIEFGAGTARKTRCLLDHAAPGCRYLPMDICVELMTTVGAALAADYPRLDIEPCCGDYHAGLDHLPRPEGRRLYLFLGGTIGNFDEDEAQAFLAEVAAHMRPCDCLLLGLDRVKARARLEAAYDDAAGLTARFNLNLLRVLNRELGADFDPAAFRHLARYDEERARIEMYLVAERDQRVHLEALDSVIELARGERILTEISRKFTRASAEALIDGAGLRLLDHHEAPGGDYSLLLAEK